MFTAEQNARAAALMASDPGSRIGPFLVGLFFEGHLLGVVLMLFFTWQKWSASKESWTIRIVIYFLVTHSILYSIFLIALNLRLLAFYFGEWAIFTDWTYARWIYLFETIARTPVSEYPADNRIFFAARAYKLGDRSKLFVAAVAPILLASTAGAIWARILDRNLFGPNGVIAPIYLWIGAEVLSDIVITSYITYHLFRSRTGWKQTDKTITKLIVLAMETQLPPTILATTFVIMMIRDPHTSLGPVFCFIPNVYVISILVVLNKRFALRRELDHEQSSYRTRIKDTYAIRSQRVVPANIQVTTETVQHVDDTNASDKWQDKTIDSTKQSLHDLDYDGSQVGLTKAEQ